MKISKYLKFGTTAFACILGSCFLLLLVDKGHITGKMTAMTTATVAELPTVYISDLSSLVVLAFIIITVATFFFFKNKKTTRNKKTGSKK